MITESMMEAVEVAEREMKPLALKTDHSVHFAEEFKVSEADVAVLANKYLELIIAGVADKKGYDIVHAGRMEVREVRTHIEKTRKRLKEASLEYGRAIDAEAKRITNMIAPVEAYLLAEETRVDDEINAIKAAKQKALDARNQGRMEALLAVGATIGLAAVVTMDDQAYVDYLALVTKDFEARQKFEAEQAAEVARKAKEEADARETERKALADERARMEAARAENDRIAAGLKAQQDEIDAQRKAIEKAAQDEQVRKDTEARIKSESERVIREAQEKADRELKAEADRKVQAEAKNKAIDAARPDAEKLQLFADSLFVMVHPEMVTDAGIHARGEILQAVINLVALIRFKAAGLTK